MIPSYGGYPGIHGARIWRVSEYGTRVLRVFEYLTYMGMEDAHVKKLPGNGRYLGIEGTRVYRLQKSDR